jgi:hypothetical protein
MTENETKRLNIVQNAIAILLISLERGYTPGTISLLSRAYIKEMDLLQKERDEENIEQMLDTPEATENVENLLKTFMKNGKPL